MKTILLALSLLVSLPAFAADWSDESRNAWQKQREQQLEDQRIQRQKQVQDYQRQWSYDQRNRGYSQESQPDRYRAYDYGQRSYDYRSP